MMIPAIEHPCGINNNRNPNKSLKKIEAFQAESKRNMTTSARHAEFEGLGMNPNPILRRWVQAMKNLRVTLLFLWGKSFREKVFDNGEKEKGGGQD